MNMDDREIIELFFGRSEAAVSATEEKYGAYFRYIAGNILGDARDVEECVNDVLATLWRLIPPAAPANFKAYAGWITRNLALKRLEHNSAVKRSGCDLILDELAPDSEEDILGTMLLRDTIHKFLSSLPEKKRRIFLRRYWYMSSIADIAADFGMSEGNVRTTLMRLRQDLRKMLAAEGIEVGK